jgi:protein-S-isoprenylcysteine O-methyltransferase Ste14
MASKPESDKAAVGVPPPVVGFTLLGLGILMEVAFPAAILSNYWISALIGLPLLIAGILLQVVCIATLRRANTTPLFSATARVVRDGLYSRSRNPMYVGIVIWNAGLPFVINTLWLLPLSPLLLLYLGSKVIPEEERYLARKFGEEYGSYQSHVRRWV